MIRSNSNFYFTVTFVYSLFAFPLFSQNEEIQSCEEAIRIGMSRSPSMQAMELEAQQLISFNPNAHYELPKTDIEGSFGQMNTRTIDQAYGISQSFNPFEAKATKNLSKVYKRKVTEELLSAENEFKYLIRTLWNHLEYNEALQKLILEKKELIKKQIEKNNDQVDPMETSKFDLLTSKIQLESIDRKEKSIQAEINSTRKKLEKELGGRNFKTDGFALDEERLLEINITDDNETLSLEQINEEIELTIAELNLENAQRKPDFSLGYFFHSIEGELEVNNQIVYFDRTPNFQGVSLGMSVALFGYKRSKNIYASNIKIAEAQAIEQASQSDIELNELKVHHELAKSNYDFYSGEVLPLINEIELNLKDTMSNNENKSEDLDNLEIYFESMESYLSSIKEYNDSIYKLLLHFN